MFVVYVFDRDSAFVDETGVMYGQFQVVGKTATSSVAFVDLLSDALYGACGAFYLKRFALVVESKRTGSTYWFKVPDEREYNSQGIPEKLMLEIGQRRGDPSQWGRGVRVLSPEFAGC